MDNIENRLTGHQSIRVDVPPGATVGRMVLRPAEDLEIGGLQVVCFEDDGSERGGDHVAFKVRITRRVGGADWPVWESTGKDGEAHDYERHVILRDTPVTVTVELLHGAKERPTIALLHVRPAAPPPQPAPPETRA